tara:strand:+ start:494 stop:748 length:255 start_codon:yes stop_codon:yes gene_type:complete
MLLTHGKFTPTISISNQKDILWVKISKICFITKKTYWVECELDYFKEMKKAQTPNFSRLSRNQRRFLIAYVTPAEFEALKKDGI